jgi:hypothetical protein
MCNDESIENEFHLNENIRIDGLTSDFKLYINNDLVLQQCKNFSYIANKLFATKSDSKIHIFAAKASNIYEKVAVISIGPRKATAKIKIDGNSYVIDYDCQITYKNRNKFK